MRLSGPWLVLRDASGPVGQVAWARRAEVRAMISGWVNREIHAAPMHVQGPPEVLAVLRDLLATLVAHGTLVIQDDSGEHAANQTRDFDEIDESDDVSFTAPIPQSYLENGRVRPGRLDNMRSPRPGVEDDDVRGAPGPGRIGKHDVRSPRPGGDGDDVPRSGRSEDLAARPLSGTGPDHDDVRARPGRIRDAEPVGAALGPTGPDDEVLRAPRPGVFEKGADAPEARPISGVAHARPPLDERGLDAPEVQPIAGRGPGPVEDAPEAQPISGVVHGRPPTGEAPRAVMARRPLHEPRTEGRSVDIALRRKGFASELVGDEDEPQDVRPNTRLAAGRKYELQVRIGEPLHGTLLAEPAPPIDPLLPPSADGHRLEVTVFGLDFALDARRAVRELWLPRSGATNTIGFAVTAPPRPGPARLRVVVSYDGHALQSFVLSAQIAHAEERAPDRALNAALEHAATARFANLESLRPREATAVINDDAGGHSITLKRGDTTGTFTFTDDQIRAAADAVRKILEDAAGSASFDEPPPRPDSPAFAERRTAYDAVIRALVVLGVQLRNALFMRADAGGKQLIRELAKTTDQRLQLIHVARSLVIPWACLYDGQIGPALEVDGWPVCNGVVDGAPCTHTGTEPRQLCVRRFWGLRHDLELVLGSAVPRDAVTAFRMPADRPPLRMLHGKSLQDVQYMPEAYTSLLYQPGVPVWDHDVYSLLDAERRPAIIAALGHFSLGTPVAGATVHAIDLVPAPLTDIGVSQQAINAGDWSFPHSIVLLMACSSAVAAADALTGMIDAFASAGAAAIIGTESTVFPRLSARAATSLYRRLIESGGKLGTAVRDLRWELVADATPLAFTFTAYGNADLAREDAT